MIFRRRRKREYEGTDSARRLDGSGADSAAERRSYEDSITDRLSRLDGYTYEYKEEDAAEVEARIRRMFYGAKVEGALPPDEAPPVAKR